MKNNKSKWIEISGKYPVAPKLECPYCKRRYPIISYILDANYCPNCGNSLKDKFYEGVKRYV